MKPRNLIKVLNEIFEIAPELKENFNSVIESTKYSAPELMYLRWQQAAAILQACAVNHPKKEDIQRIFSGKQILND